MGETPQFGGKPSWERAIQKLGLSRLGDESLWTSSHTASLNLKQCLQEISGPFESQPHNFISNCPKNWGPRWTSYFSSKQLPLFFFWGFYGYADEPDVKRMLWSLGEKLWSLFWWRGCCHNEFQMPLVPSTQQVADPTILTSIFCVLQFLPEVFRHETLWSFQHALRDSSSIGGVSSLVTSCNRKVTSMYDQFFFKSTIVQRRKSTPKKMPEEPRLLCVPCGRWTREHPHDKPATRWTKWCNSETGIFFWSRPRWTLCFQLLRLFFVYIFRWGYSISKLDPGLARRNSGPFKSRSCKDGMKCLQPQSEWDLVCPEQLLNWRRQWPIISYYRNNQYNQYNQYNMLNHHWLAEPALTFDLSRMVCVGNHTHCAQSKDQTITWRLATRHQHSQMSDFPHL